MWRLGSLGGDFSPATGDSWDMHGTFIGISPTIRGNIYIYTYIIYIYIYTFDTLRLLHDSCLDLASHAPPIHGSQVALCACRPLRWNLIPQAVSTSGQLHSYGGQTKIDKQRGQ